MFKKISCQKNDAFKDTYRAVLLLGKRGKPFGDVDIIKESIIEVVGCIHPENISKYKELPFSRITITTRQHELASNLKQQLNSTIYFFLFFIFLNFYLYIYPPDSQESDGGAIHRVSNYPDLLPEMPRYCCPLVI